MSMKEVAEEHHSILREHGEHQCRHTHQSPQQLCANASFAIRRGRGRGAAAAAAGAGGGRHAFGGRTTGGRFGGGAHGHPNKSWSAPSAQEDGKGVGGQEEYIAVPLASEAVAALGGASPDTTPFGSGSGSGSEAGARVDGAGAVNYDPAVRGRGFGGRGRGRGRFASRGRASFAPRGRGSVNKSWVATPSSSSSSAESPSVPPVTTA